MAGIRRKSMIVGAAAFTLTASLIPGLSAQELNAKEEPVAAMDGLAIAAAQPNIRIRVGDQVKLAFYEMLDVDEAKWRGANGRASAAPIGFHQRGELSGSYAVQEDGTISLPLIGSFNVAGDTASAMIDKLGKPYASLVGRRGFVNVLSIERQPVYIVGPVKSPGSFKYQPNLTALHIIALAGGLRRSESETWQTADSRRELALLEKTLERVKRLVARTTVLRAERDGGATPVKEVVSLSGVDDGRTLLDQEKSQRRLTEVERAVQNTALRLALSNSRAELTSRTGRLSPYDDNIKLRTERIKGLEQLASQNLTTRLPLVQAQGELADVQDRRQQALIDIDITKQKMVQAEQDLAKHSFDTRLEVDKAIAIAERDGAEAVADGEGSLNIIRSLTSDRGTNEDSLVYEIVRQTKNGTQAMKVSETTILEPGDLLRIRSSGQSGR